MNLNFWSWELKFWTVLVLRRSGSDRWFPSPKQISRFQNQNLCENLNRTSFARTSWFLVKVHIKANNCRITLFEQFRILKWINRPQNRNLHEKSSKTSPSWKFWLLIKICAKVNFLKIWQFVQFMSLEKKITNSKIRMFAKNWVGQAPFENFDFLVKVKVQLSQSFFFFSFYLFFIFLVSGSSDRVRFLGRVQETGQVELEGDAHEGATSAWECVRFHRGMCWHVLLKATTTGSFGGAWRRVDCCLSLKFWGVVDRRL